MLAACLLVGGCELSDDNISFAVTVARNEGHWVVREFDDDFEDINTSINAVRALRSEGAAFALRLWRC